MVVYWVAAAELLFYLCAVPLRMAFCLRSEGEIKFGAGIGFFERRFALNQALARLSGEKPAGKFFKLRWKNIPDAGKLIWGFVKRIQIDQVSLYGRFSMGDAASTALICGGVNALACALRAATPKVSMNIHPEFNHSSVHIELQGMICVRTGQVMFAAILSGLNYANGRIAQWISTQLKAS